MNTFKSFTLLLAMTGLVVIAFSCEKNKTGNPDTDPGDPVIISLETSQKNVVDSANRFAFDLFKTILSESKGAENIMISPFSISSALSMTLNGATGETFDVMKKALRLENSSLDEINSTYLKLMSEMVPVDERVTVEIANSVWVEKRLNVKQQFIDDLNKWYEAEARGIDVTDPNAVKTVNNWIAGKTHDKITDMLDKLDSNLAMLLINAVYFNGKWRYRFNTDETKEELFYLSPSIPEKVPMMHLEENFKVAKLGNATLIDLPYGQGNYSMTVILPDEGYNVSDLSGDLDPAKWNTWMEILDGNTHKVDLSMPKFKYSYKRLLNDDLVGLGMGQAFSGMATFNNISDQGLYIDAVIHQSFIETNEEGTEAAAATVVEIGFTSAGPDVQPTVLKVDINRPFLYCIHETSTGTILFIGKVDDPVLE